MDTLEYLIRGGRIGKAAGLAGQLLSVKPILVFDDGEVAPNAQKFGNAWAEPLMGPRIEGCRNVAS